MTIPPSAPPVSGGTARHLITCHICLSEFVPNVEDLYKREASNEIHPLKIPPGSSRKLELELMRNALVLCPTKVPAAHYLPIDFARYEKPIVIGLVGKRGTGKSTLLASMIDEIEKKNGLRDYGLRATPLVPDRHEQFQFKYLENLNKGQTLEATAPAAADVDYADGILLIKSGETPKPVVFWDVGGESFTLPNDEFTRFIQAFTALIFLVDPDALKGPRIEDDRTFRRVFDRLNADSGDMVEYLDKPAAIVIAKADKLRFEPFVARWLTRRAEPGGINSDRVREESRDIYAFLYQRQALWSLVPFDVFKKCTLHVVSATGSGAPQPKQSAPSPGLPSYARPLRPRRVLEPLVAILAMAGAIKTPGADQVGR